MDNDTCTKTDESCSCDCGRAFAPETLLKESGVQEAAIRRLKIEILAGGILFAAAFLLDRITGASDSIVLTLYIAAYMVLGFSVLFKAAVNISKGEIFDENFLMAIATIGALAIWQWSEAAAVMLFYQVGELFQKSALHRSRRSIAELAAMRPDYANVMKGEELVRVHPDAVAIGDVIVVKPGEKVPLDGVVRDGCSMLDTSALTGESLLREVEPGDPILSGCINRAGVLSVEVTAGFGESTVSKIIEMVTNAGSRKTKSENMITRFAKVYTPVVVIGAVLLAVIPTLFFGGVFSVWLYRALSFLVISCPCALVISVPLGYFGGIGAASRRGILIKGSHYLDALQDTDQIVFDKTGTLTSGVFSVTRVVSGDGLQPEELVRLALIAEAYSDHPIALSVRNAARERKIEAAFPDPSAYKETAGRGVSVLTENGEIHVGNRKWMMDTGISGVPEIEADGTVLFVAADHTYAGYLEIADQVRPEASRTIAMLRELRVTNLSILTGDHKASAENVAEELCITQVYPDLLPAQKLEKMEEIFASRKTDQQKNGSVLFVGDGINDAPVLARADVGIAIGAMASGAAIEAADVVIMTDDLTALPRVIRIAKKTRRIIIENIVFALTVKGLILILAAFGLTNLWFAIFADVGVAMIAILNAIRAGR